MILQNNSEYVLKISVTNFLNVLGTSYFSLTTGDSYGLDLES